eukprot:scaffold310_cov168-Amphora_coffeaeformis.AAC.49
MGSTVPHRIADVRECASSTDRRQYDDVDAVARSILGVVGGLSGDSTDEEKDPTTATFDNSNNTNAGSSTARLIGFMGKITVALTTDANQYQEMVNADDVNEE